MRKTLNRLANTLVGRALPIDMIRESAWDFLDNRSMMADGYVYPHLHNIFMDEDTNYIVFFEEGAAFRSNFVVSSGEVNFEEAQKVEFQHTPVETSRVRLERGVDGKLYWYAIACSAVVNRVGEIDSTSLFQMFEDDFATYETNPFMTYYHEQHEGWHFGEVLGVSRDNNLLLAWGTIDEKHPLGKAAAENINSGEWGLSIGYIPTSKAREVEIAEDIKIRVFDTGILVEISLLKEIDAAAPFTQISVSNN